MPSYGVLYVRLADNRTEHTSKIEDELRRALPKIEGVGTSVEDVPFIDLGEQKPIDFAVVGDDAAAVEREQKSDCFAPFSLLPPV